MMETEIYYSESKELWQYTMEQDLYPGELIIEIARFSWGLRIVQARSRRWAGRSWSSIWLNLIALLLWKRFWPLPCVPHQEKCCLPNCKRE